MVLRQNKLFYGSSYDRGLDILLPMWPKIREMYPDAELHVCYGWNLFEAGFRDNPERMNWMRKIDDQMKQDGIFHHGRVGKEELKKIRSECGIWVYPTYFPEILCITALECQNDGVVPCVVDYGALTETVQSGVKVEGDIFDKETQEKFLDELLKLMGDQKRWGRESKKAIEFAREFSWDKVADKWLEHI